MCFRFFKGSFGPFIAYLIVFVLFLPKTKGTFLLIPTENNLKKNKRTETDKKDVNSGNIQKLKESDRNWQKKKKRKGKDRNRQKSTEKERNELY